MVNPPPTPPRSANVSRTKPKPAKPKANLRSRLLTSQLVVLAVAIIALASVSRLYTPRYFVVTLERMERQGVRVQQVKGQLLRGFEDAWIRGMIWSIISRGSRCWSDELLAVVADY